MRLYLRFFSLHLRAQMQYRISFILLTVGQFVSAFTVFLGIRFMYMRWNSVEGYTLGETLLCSGIVLMAFSIAECFFRGFDSFGGILAQGEFDRMLVRPKNVIFQVVCSKIEFSRIGRMAQAALMFALAVPASGIRWSAAKVLVLLLSVSGAVVLFSALFVVYASFCFFTTEGLEFMNIFTDGGREFGRYPASVYGREILFFTTCVIPVACVQYYPLLYLTGRTDTFLYGLTPLAATLFTLPALLFFKIGLAHYKSTGS